MADWRSVAERVRNWGKWGAEDQLGTLNYVTPEVVRRAAGLVKQGKTIPLGAAFNGDGPQGAHGFRRNPIHIMSVDGGDEGSAKHLAGWGGSTEAQMSYLYTAGPMRFNDDFIILPLQAGTQWDSLAHVYYDGQLYNGYPASAVTSFGATRNGIDKIAERGAFVGRGVLLDVAQQRGVPYLAPNTPVTPEDLDAVAKAEGVEVQPGDVLIVRTGWWANFLETRDGEAWTHGSPGLSWRCAEWLHERRVAAVACDNIAVEVSPTEVEGVILVFHLLTIRDMGMMLGEMWDLEALGRDCAEDGVYEFQLVAQPLNVTGAVGSPLNPIAIK
jgi:kynurenine formamidase